MSSTVSSTTSTASTGNVFTNLNQATAASSNAQQLQTQFLQLLTTQLENQDPTNPADSNQMTSQLAQISMVSGIQDLNSSLTSMSATFNAAQSFQAANLIGQQVLATGNAMVYDGKDSVTAQITVPANAGKVTASIYDSNNNLVDTIPLGNAAAGQQTVTWNGQNQEGAAMPSGNYTIVAQAAGAAGSSPSTLTTATYVGVTSVSIGSSGVSLGTTGGQSIAMTDVQQIK